jgi:thiamine-phosphate pyrophosphorylase
MSVIGGVAGGCSARRRRGAQRHGFLVVSTHDPRQVEQALADHADYVAVGSIFPTGTKAGFQLVGPDLVRTLRPTIPVPLVAKAASRSRTWSRSSRRGAAAVAVVSAICGAPPAEATRRFLERIETAQRGRCAYQRWSRCPSGCYLLHNGEAGRNGSCSP